MLRIAALPDRLPPVTCGLPYPFARAQVDAERPAFTLTPAGLVVSTDAWSDRHLALFSEGEWHRVTAGEAWYRNPVWSGRELSATVYDDVAAERAKLLPIHLERARTGPPARVNSRAVTIEGNNGYGSGVQVRPSALGEVLTHPALGEVTLPAGAKVEAVAASDSGRPRAAVLLRRGSARRVMCIDADHTSRLDTAVVALGPWLSNNELVIVMESWPGRRLCGWNVRTGALRTLVGSTTIVVDDVQSAPGQLALSWTNPEQPRRVDVVDLSELQSKPWSLQPDPLASPVLPAYFDIVDGRRCGLPCVLRDPSGPPRGTVLLLHGGPHGANLATWSPFAQSLTLAGWRVVQPNVRGSGLLDPKVRLPAPGKYGRDDVDDVISVLRRVATGPVVAGGLSYGGYLAARTAQACPEIRGVFLLGGFLRLTDLAGSNYPQVQAFLRNVGERFETESAFAPVPHFVAHGTADPRIPADAVLAHTKELATGSVTIPIPGEGHGMVTDHAARLVFPSLFSWLDDLARPRITRPANHWSTSGKDPPVTT
jgi:dipeptidyl aminopeptidase/acylaminoacyl peptidase